MKFLPLLVFSLPLLLAGCATDIGYSDGGYNSYPGYYSNNAYGHNYNRDAYNRNSSYVHNANNNHDTGYQPANRYQTNQQSPGNVSTTHHANNTTAQAGNQSNGGGNRKHSGPNQNGHDNNPGH